MHLCPWKKCSSVKFIIYSLFKYTQFHHISYLSFDINLCVPHYTEYTIPLLHVSDKMSRDRYCSILLSLSLSLLLLYHCYCYYYDYYFCYYYHYYYHYCHPFTLFIVASFYPIYCFVLLKQEQSIRFSVRYEILELIRIIINRYTWLK